MTWARKQRGWTFEEVATRGGPSRGYLCELEKGDKANPRPKMMKRLCAALGITERFARGEIPKYHHNPAQCKGLAADVQQRIVSDAGIRAMMSRERTRTILRIACDESTHLTRLVVAHVLDTDLASVEDMINNQQEIHLGYLQILADLTLVPEMFFTHGVLREELDDYISVIVCARQQGLTPQALEGLINSRNRPTHPQGEYKGGRASTKVSAARKRVPQS